MMSRTLPELPLRPKARVDIFPPKLDKYLHLRLLWYGAFGKSQTLEKLCTYRITYSFEARVGLILRMESITWTRLPSGDSIFTLPPLSSSCPLHTGAMLVCNFEINRTTYLLLWLRFLSIIAELWLEATY